MKFIFLIGLFSLGAYAQVQVQIVDPEIDASTFQEDGYKVETKATPHNVLPEIETRDNFLSGIKIPAKWGQLEKDIFYMDLKSKSLEKLQIKYPEFPSKQLKELKAQRG